MKKLLIILALVLLVMGCSTPPPITISAKLSFITGVVKVTHNGVTKRAELGMRLYPADKIETGANSEARILFANIGISKIRPNTVIQINRLLDTHKSEEIQMSISKGRVLSSLKKLGRKNDCFEINTPTAVAGVRGTTFLVDVDSKKVTRASVFAGKVEIRKKVKAGEAKGTEKEEVIVIEELKEVVVPEEDFSKAKVVTMSHTTYNKEIKELKEMKEIEEVKKLDIPEIKEEIVEVEKKWAEVKVAAPKEAPKVEVKKKAPAPAPKKKKAPEKIQW